MPAILSVWVALCLTGDLGHISRHWRGWRINRDGDLQSEELASESFRPGDVMAIPYVRALVKSYQRDQRGPRQADFISGKFEPARELGADSARAQAPQDQEPEADDYGERQRRA